MLQEAVRFAAPAWALSRRGISSADNAHKATRLKNIYLLWRWRDRVCVGELWLQPAVWYAQGVWGVLGGFEWSPAVRPLVTALSIALQNRTLDVLQRAYATITAAQLASYLGMQEADAVQSKSPNAFPNSEKRRINILLSYIIDNVSIRMSSSAASTITPLTHILCWKSHFLQHRFQ